MTVMQWLTALMPVLSVAVLLVGLGLPAAKAMPLALGVTIALAMAVWKVSLGHIAAATLEGLIIASSVLLIVVGALAFLEVMRAGGGLALIRLEFLKISPDARIQVLFVGWLLVCFIEGAAGFGTPAPVAAPLLMALGFPAIAAVSLALIADVSAVTFGAVGTPIIVGLANGTGRDFANPADAGFLTGVALQAAAIDIVAGLFIPVLMMYLLTNVFATEKGMKPFLEMIPLAVLAALSYSIPAYLWTTLLGVEFGAILGAATGMVIMFVVVRLKLFVPQQAWSPTVGYIDEQELDQMLSETSKEAADAHLSPLRVWAPYLLLTVLLLFTRVYGDLKELLNSYTLGWEDILGEGITAGFEPLYSPGLIFLIVAAFTAWLHHVRGPKAKIALNRTVAAAGGTALVLATSVPIVRVFLNSGVNGAGLASMPLELAEVASSGIGHAWPLAAPWVGSLGSFVSGSATFSHLMFSSLQESVATGVGLNPTVVLAQQVGGANAGNMICVMNVVAVAAVCGLLGREGEIIRRTALPMFVYTLVFALAGFLLA
ncbi:MAG: L-lactate permease [Candidatus Nanopelagicales bacterium]